MNLWQQQLQFERSSKVFLVLSLRSAVKRGKFGTEWDAVCRTANLVIFTNESAAIGEYVCLDGVSGYDGLEVLYVWSNFSLRI